MFVNGERERLAPIDVLESTMPHTASDLDDLAARLHLKLTPTPSSVDVMSPIGSSVPEWIMDVIAHDHRLTALWNGDGSGLPPGRCLILSGLAREESGFAKRGGNGRVRVGEGPAKRLPQVEGRSVETVVR